MLDRNLRQRGLEEATTTTGPDPTRPKAATNSFGF
jgi:hypothetical protein